MPKRSHCLDDNEQRSLDREIDSRDSPEPDENEPATSLLDILSGFLHGYPVHLHSIQHISLLVVLVCLFLTLFRDFLLFIIV